MPISREIKIQTGEEGFVAQLLAERMQHRAALGIRVAIKHGIAVWIAVGGNRALITSRFREIRLHGSSNFSVVAIRAARVLKVHHLHVGGKALV